MVKVITGIRRCGKSFLLFKIFKKYLIEDGIKEDHIIEIALDGIENEELRNPKTCHQYIKTMVKDKDRYYLLLDEIQFMPRFEEVLNSLLRLDNVDTGIIDVYGKDKEGKRIRKQLDVDFVVNQGSRRYYIQVVYDMASEGKQTQEFHSLRNIPDSLKKIVIVGGMTRPWRNDEGFVIMGMRYFLLNPDSLEF